jgi:hypothetical protein
LRGRELVIEKDESEEKQQRRGENQFVFHGRTCSRVMCLSTVCLAGTLAVPVLDARLLYPT